jgi:hypothetical protein
MNAAQERHCLQCGTAITDPGQAVVTDEGPFCLPCFRTLEQHVRGAVKAQSAGINYTSATVGALLGGIVGALVWWGFTALTRISFGLVALVIGLAVGKGILFFTGGRRSRGLQFLSVGVSALAFFYAQYLVTRTFLLRYFQEQQAGLASLPFFPDPATFIDVIRMDFGLFDFIFLAIVAYEAWIIPAPFRVRAGLR